MLKYLLLSVYITGILLSGAGTSASADVTVTVEGTYANPGDRGIVVPITVDDATGIAGIDITLTFDSNILTATGAQATALTSGFMILANPTPGQIKISMAKVTGIPSGSGAVVEVLFDVNPDTLVGEGCDLILENLIVHSELAEEISSIAVNGKFKKSQL